MRRLSLSALALVVVLVGAHTFVWRGAEQRLQSGFASWVALRRAEGWTVTTGTPAYGGWPLAATLTVPDFSLAGAQADIPGGLTFGGERAVLAVSLLHPRLLTVSFVGGQHVRLGGLPDIPFRADSLTGSFPLVPGARSADIDATNLRAGLPFAEGSAGSVTIALMRAHFETKPAAPQGEPAISFSGSAEDIALSPRPAPAPPSWPLGDHVASVSVEGAVDGPLPRAPDLVARATGWRDGGGTLEIHRLAVGWGPLGLTGSATLALDERLQPMGAASVRMVGQVEALDTLAANHAITQRAAMAAKAVLSLMTHQPEGGGTPEVVVPLTLQKQVLSMGRIPLARIADWIWPSAP